ncbi:MULTISPECIES: DMT family transporter [unclassified Gilliamella]|uniref:DMT family transporter n=1 Tax=unclassified Gilliamella TaxID=2685620 RepID=UPI0013231AF2|nr:MULTISPECIES: EamA family transporter [unclassified Gilliamella]MWN32063.1 EamA family transporter [Gilliamella sp. Pra-s60]MWP29322.1 EamA family transporter [Gilliamella sp. Pra-s54]MWP46994.1 EamA family transporter [Gilliamella sp. Pas-s27]
MNKVLGILAVILASILWGTTGTAATFAPSLSPLLIGSLAMGIGGILQCILAISKIIKERHLLIKHLCLLIVGAIAVMIYPLAFYSSMRLSGVTIGTVVSIGSAPILSALIEYISRDFRLTKQWVIGAACGILGIILLAFSEDNSTTTQYEHTTIGILLGLIAGFTYALYSWSARQLMLKGISTKSSMGATFGCGGILLIPVMLLTGATLFDSLINITVCIYMALIPMFMGYLCYGYGLSKISASSAITISLLEPVIATILAMLIIAEQISLIGWVGIILVFLCLIFVTLSSVIKISTST